MFITQVYKYRKDGIVYVGGNLPQDATILETMNILNAENNYTLIRISDNEDIGTSIWLRDGDIQENYKEIEQQIEEKE